MLEVQVQLFPCSCPNSCSSSFPRETSPEACLVDWRSTLVELNQEVKMGVRIRFSRFGCKHRPFYRVIAADSKATREGKHLEVLGFYNPLAGEDVEKRMSLNLERLKYWLSVGAQPSDPVQRLISKTGLLHPNPMVATEHKGGPHDTLAVHPLPGGALSFSDSANADQSKGDEDGGKGEETISMDDVLCLSIPVKN